MKKFILLLLLFATAAIKVSNANTTRDIGDEPKLSKKVISQWIIFYTNIERVKKGLLPLEIDSALEEAAIWQAEYCVKINNLNHNANVAGMKEVQDRMSNFNRKCGFCGENLTVRFSVNSEGISFRIRNDEQGTYYDYGNYTIFWRNERQMAFAMVDSWMKSPHHRENILNPGFSWMGAGAETGIYNKNKSYYGCQVFNGFGKMPPDYLQLEYKLNSLHSEKRKINGKDAYLFSYDGDMRVGVIEVSADSDPVPQDVAREGNKYIFIIPQKIKGHFFAALYDKDSKILYPVKLLQ